MWEEQTNPGQVYLRERSTQKTKKKLLGPDSNRDPCPDDNLLNSRIVPVGGLLRHCANYTTEPFAVNLGHLAVGYKGGRRGGYAGAWVAGGCRRRRLKAEKGRRELGRQVVADESEPWKADTMPGVVGLLVGLGDIRACKPTTCAPAHL